MRSKTQKIKNSEIDTKKQLYILFLDLKSKITNKKEEIDKKKFINLVNNVKITVLINYIKELINTLFNQKTEKENNHISKSILDNNNVNNITQLENYIKKLEFDIRYYAKRLFQDKIEKDTLESKLNSYIEIENNYKELKEKVKYENGKFLNNERKENEIIILRQENTILKNELAKSEEKNQRKDLIIKGDQHLILNLKNQIINLTKRDSQLELKDSNNNSSIYINNEYNNNSSNMIIKSEFENTISINTKGNRNCSTKNNIKNIKYLTKNNICKLNIRTKLNNEIPNNINGLKKNSNKKEINSINNSIVNSITSTYNKIFSKYNLRKNNNLSKSKIYKNQRKKNNSISMRINDYDKFLSSNISKCKEFKNNEYINIIGMMPNTRFPLSSKNQSNKNSKKLFQKKYSQKQKTNNNSSINIRRNYNE